MKIRVNVTKEILERTKHCRAKIDSCAVSEAVREIFPDAHTTYRYIRPFPDTDYEMEIALPPMVTAFIISFDGKVYDEQRAKMQPISFDIEVPDSVIERIGIGQVYKILSESKTLEYVG